MSNTVAWACTGVMIRVFRVSFGLSIEQVLGQNLMTFFVSLGLVCLVLDGFRIYKYFSTTD